MRALEFLTGHVIFKLCYNQIYQLKTTKENRKQKRKEEKEHWKMRSERERESERERDRDREHAIDIERQ